MCWKVCEKIKLWSQGMLVGLSMLEWPCYLVLYLIGGVFPLVRSVTIWISGSQHMHHLGTMMYWTDIMFPLVTFASVWTDGSLHTHDHGTAMYQTDTVFHWWSLLLYAPMLWDPLHTWPWFTHQCCGTHYTHDLGSGTNVVGPIIHMTLVHAPMLWDPLHTWPWFTHQCCGTH